MASLWNKTLFYLGLVDEDQQGNEQIEGVQGEVRQVGGEPYMATPPAASPTTASSSATAPATARAASGAASPARAASPTTSASRPPTAHRA